MRKERKKKFCSSPFPYHLSVEWLSPQELKPNQKQTKTLQTDTTTTKDDIICIYWQKEEGGIKNKQQKQQQRQSEAAKLSRMDEERSSCYFNTSQCFSSTLKPSVFKVSGVWHCWVTFLCIMFAKEEEAPHCRSCLILGEKMRSVLWARNRPTQACLKGRS